MSQFFLSCCAACAHHISKLTVRMHGYQENKDQRNQAQREREIERERKRERERESIMSSTSTVTQINANAIKSEIRLAIINQKVSLLLLLLVDSRDVLFYYDVFFLFSR